jgi:hypothetical protein
MREEIEGLLRLTGELEQDAAALVRAIGAELERERRRRLALAARAGRESWRWN